MENQTPVRPDIQFNDFLAPKSYRDSGALTASSSEAVPDKPVIDAVEPFVSVEGSRFGVFVRRYIVVLILLFLVGVAGILVIARLAGNSESELGAASGVSDTEVSLANIPGQDEFGFGGRSLTINGPVEVNDAFILTPQSQPVQGTAGQIYFDQTTNILNYHNGTEFVALQGGGAGDTITNTTNNLVTNNIVTSFNGTAGRLAKFTSSQNLEDSLLSESGSTVTVSGTLGVTSLLGVGTAAPSRPLHILTNNATTDAPSLLVEQDGSGDSSLEFKTSNNKSFFVGMDASGGSSFNIASSTSAAATFDVGENDETCCFSTTSSTNDIWVAQATVGGTGGTLSSISVYTPSVDAISPGAQVALYTDSGGLPDNLVAVSNEQDLTVGWNVFSMTGSVSANTTYWLAFSFEGNSIRRFGSGTHQATFTATYGTWPDLGGVTPTFNNPGLTTPIYMTVVPVGTVDSFDGINLLSVTEAGASTFRNSTDSGGAFRVLNADAVPQFVIDTSNSRVYIGNPTADTTGALLVLDTKSDADDPTGVNGAMYYSADRETFRCYEDDFWRDCMETSRANIRYRTEMIDAAGSDSVFGHFTNGGTVSELTGEANHPGIIQSSTSTSTTGNAGTATNNANDDWILLANDDAWRYETALRIPTLSSAGEPFTVRSGFQDNFTADSTDGCYFRYSHSLNSGEWQGVCRAASSESTCDSNIAVSSTSWYRLTIAVNAAGTTAQFLVNGSSVCQVGLNVPATAGQETNIMSTITKDGSGTTARTLDHDYVEAMSFISPR